MGSTLLLGGAGGACPSRICFNSSALRLILTTFSRYLTITTVEHIYCSFLLLRRTYCSKFDVIPTYTHRATTVFMSTGQTTRFRER